MNDIVENRYTSEEFDRLTKEEVLKSFTKHNNLYIYFGKHRVSLTLVPGIYFGIKFTDMLCLLIAEENRSHFTEEEGDYKEIVQAALSPHEYEKAVMTLIRAYKNTREGKRTIIKPLTDKEIDYIVFESNKPVG